MSEKGLLFHAKHAFMPNHLGYCGPDDRGRILQALEQARGGEELIGTLREFEAAYPFLRLISRSTGREPFDYSVPEAYWIGNGLLEKVPVPEFYRFSHRELVKRNPKEVKKVFKALERAAVPHHTFYVMSTYATSSVADGPNIGNASAEKVGKLVDDCRISWGTVRKVEDHALEVEYTPVIIEEGVLSFAEPTKKKVSFTPEVSPFGNVRQGDVVSVHWGYACEVLDGRQVRNLAKYTSRDMESVNRLLAAREP